MAFRSKGPWLLLTLAAVLVSLAMPNFLVPPRVESKQRKQRSGVEQHSSVRMEVGWWEVDWRLNEPKYTTFVNLAVACMNLRTVMYNY